MKTPQQWAASKAGKWILIALAVVAAGWALGTIQSWHTAAKANGATVIAQGQKIEATAGIGQDAAVADSAKANVDTAVSAARDDFHTATTEARRHEPASAARADRPVPASVRNAAHARRLARERSAGIESQP